MSQFCAKHRLGPRPDTQLGDESLSGHMDRVVVADGPPPLDDADKVLSLQVLAGCLLTLHCALCCMEDGLSSSSSSSKGVQE